MPETVVGLFRTRDEQQAAVRKLEGAGFSRDQVSTATPLRNRRGHYGRKLLIGILIGTALGGIVGAVATGMLPGVRPLTSGNLLATFALALVAGAATGSLAGMLVSMAAAGDAALFYEQEVESGRFLVSVRGDRLDLARATLQQAGALEAAPIEAPIKPERPRPESG